MITFSNHSTDPYYNLAFEEYIFTAFRGEDVFLLWRNRPCVVVGSGQNICRETSPVRLRRLGIPVLRRISGGGTVYHDPGNVNYSLMTRQQGGPDYDRCLAPVLEALHALGVPAEKSGVCDIVLGGKKISGSAQRAASGRLLHHGTLLFDADLTALDDLSVRSKNDCVRTKGAGSAIRAVTNIRPHLAEDMTVEEFQRRLLDRMVPDAASRLEPTEEQTAAAARLAEEKYKSWEWTWGKTPAFTYAKTGVFAGAPISISYQARKGLLSCPRIDSPFIDGERASALLDGARLDPEGLEKICRTLAGARAAALWELLL